jgi:hypothetical protein
MIDGVGNVAGGCGCDKIRGRVFRKNPLPEPGFWVTLSPVSRSAPLLV